MKLLRRIKCEADKYHTQTQYREFSTYRLANHLSSGFFSEQLHSA